MLTKTRFVTAALLLATLGAAHAQQADREQFIDIQKLNEVITDAELI